MLSGNMFTAVITHNSATENILPNSISKIVLSKIHMVDENRLLSWAHFVMTDGAGPAKP